jgi:glycosyltransferase involved in cell wall biosynthesis
MRQNLMLVGANIPRSLTDEIARDRNPRADFFELSKHLNARIVSFEEIDSATGSLVKLVSRATGRSVEGFWRRAGRSVALALVGFWRRKDFDLVLTTSETIGMPLALLLKLSGTNKRHLMVGHYLSQPKKTLIWKLFGLHTHISMVFVYSTAQQKVVVSELHMPPEKVVRIPYSVDQRFFRPIPDIVEKNQICAVGLESRDYPTLIKAAKGLQCEVKIAADSQYSKFKNEVEGSDLPLNVTVGKYKYPELRRLYAESKIVVVPLYQIDHAAGVTSVMEAMAMGKPVIVTRTIGQRDTVVNGETGLYVSPGDTEDLQQKMQWLLQNDGERKRIGENARRAVDSSFTLEHLVSRISKLSEPETYSDNGPEQTAAMMSVS